MPEKTKTKLGIVVFANDSGLGAQTRRLTQMLRPYRILAIDSSGFSKNASQHFNWYDGFSGYKVQGFPTNREVKTFLEGLTHVIVCENPLNFYLLTESKRRGIKVFIQSNYEFCDHLNNELDLPEKFIMPSYWKIDEMRQRFGSQTVDYLPPPIDPQEFQEAREINLGRQETCQDDKRYLHVVGTLAAHDRNGTLDLLAALPHCQSDFQLTIKSQHDLPPEYMTNDKRVRYQIGNEAENGRLYHNFDALILPRRYGGLSLTTCEALMSGLPVIMTNISPNNQLLPEVWLVDATKKGEFKTRTMIDIYQTDPQLLAAKIDSFTSKDDKLMAFEIGYNEFSTTVLKPKYERLIECQSIG